MRPLRLLLYAFTSYLVSAVALLGLFASILTGLVTAPLLAIGLATVERRRLGLLGQPVPPSPHRQPAPGLLPWLRLRYREAATWRALAYAVLMGTVVGLVNVGVVAALGGLVYGIAVRPFVDGNWVPSLGFGFLLIPALGLALAVATGQAALARGLLGGATEQEVVELTSSRARLVDAFEVERRRIERDLHDGAQQRLVALSMTLGLASVELADGPGAARDLVARAGEQAQAALGDLRALVRGIHPQVLTDLGLAAAVAELADRSPVPVAVVLDLPVRLPSTVESCAYFVVAEALTNAARHAGASAVTVHGGLVAGVLRVEIGDDGDGGADPAAGSGLVGLADRVAAIGGTLALSSPLGGPTVLRLELPCSAS